MATVEVAKIPRKQSGKRDMYATLCYYYPQYNLQQAADMPARDLTLLLKTARKMEARKMHNLVQIAAAPHSKKAAGVKRLSSHFAKEAK